MSDCWLLKKESAAWSRSVTYLSFAAHFHALPRAHACYVCWRCVLFCFQVSRACLLPEDEWGDGTTLGPGNVCLQFNFFVMSRSEVCLTASSTVRGMIVKRQSNKQISYWWQFKVLLVLYRSCSGIVGSNTTGCMNTCRCFLCCPVLWHRKPCHGYICQWVQPDMCTSFVPQIVLSRNRPRDNSCTEMWRWCRRRKILFCV